MLSDINIDDLTDAGLALLWLRPRSKAPVEDGWSHAPRRSADKLRQTYRDGCNVGVRLGEPSHTACGYLHAIDLDIRDAGRREEALAALRKWLPQPERFPTVISGSGGESRHLYFLSDRPFRSRKLAHSAEKFSGPDGREHWTWEVDLLATGKQVVLPPSVHPDTGQPYRWLQPFGMPEIDGLAPTLPGSEVERWGTDNVDEHDVSNLDEDADFLAQVHAAPANLTETEIEEALDALPRAEWCEDRDGWLRVGAALHHQFEGAERGFELWEKFSRQSDKFDSRDQRRVWKSFSNKRRGTTFRTLLAAAQQASGRALSPTGDKALKFAKDKQGILPTAANIILGLGVPEFLGADIRWDEFKHELVRSEPGVRQWRRFEDSDFFDIRLRLEHAGFKPLNRLLIRDAVKHHANASRIDTAMVWLDSLHWDGARRVERFWVDYFGAEDTAYARACGRYVWTALAGRVRQPGCQADMVPVICGPQGIGKSRGIRAMAPAADFFTSLSFHESEIERARKMRGTLIGEMAELQGLKSRGLDEIKAWITRPTEHWTPKWEEMSTVFHRRCIIFATTNESDFLNDPTGERRWLPITATSVNVTAVQQDQAQLWAEADALFEISGVDWQGAQRLAPVEHANFRSADMWEEPIRTWMESAAFDDARPCDRPFILMADVARYALRMEPGMWKRGDEMRIGRVLAHLGWKTTLRRVGGAPTRVWVKEPG